MSVTAKLLAGLLTLAFLAAAAWPNLFGTLIFAAVGFGLLALLAFIMRDDERRQ